MSSSTERQDRTHVLPQAVDDPQRLQAVAELGLLDAPFEERFDRITRTAQRLLGVPLAFLNLVAQDTVWITSGTGAAGRQVDRDIAFCSHAVASPTLLLVDDTAQDARFADNPLVVGAPGIRSYAGRPLRGPTGQVVGTLCVMDLAPRVWTAEQRGALEDLGAWAETELARGSVEQRLAAGEQVRRQHASVLRSAGQGIFGVDAAGTVTVANPAAAALTGWAVEDLVGTPLHAVLHPGGADAPECSQDPCPLSAQALLGSSVVRRRDVLVRRHGPVVPTQVSSAPMLDAGAVVGAVVVLDDITEQLAVDRLKDEFLSVVSHELRTPLTSLRGSLGLLAAGVLGPLPEQAQSLADMAVASTDRLVRLVADILDLERLVAGQVVLERRQHALAALVQAAVDAVSGTAQAAQVEVAVHATDGEAEVDGDRVVQVLVNLLGNAVKFSPAGSTVHVHAERSDGEVRLRVEDSGRGIPADQLERVFERFAQVDASDSRDRGGSGLGLAITRNVVEAHGGSIRASSEVGVGSTFRVVLPQ